MIIVLYLTLLFDNSDKRFLPKWLTPEESLRISEIGLGHQITSPPTGWVETPGEFERLRGVLLTWRYGIYDAIFRAIVREVVSVAKAYIIVRNSTEQSNVANYLTAGGVALDSVFFIIYPNNSIWIRDYGPWFIRKQDNTEGIIDFIYNRPRRLDDTIPWRLGRDWNISVFGSPLIHAGGNFMVDGLGTGFATTLIHQENPSFTPQQIDSLMLLYNGLEQFVTLPRIEIEYTGHIDIWAKILNDTLVMVGYYPPGHPNHTILNDNADSISRCKNREGINYRIVRIPMPWSISEAPPTYLNSLFVNNKVLVPIWGLPEDDTALLVYRQALPGHQIIGIDCSAMLGSGGAIHCITMQVPSLRYIHIRHRPLTITTDTIVRIRAQVITSNTLLPESTLIFYKIGRDTIFNTTPLFAVVDTPGVYAGYIPAQTVGETVYYYLSVKNSDGLKRTSPNYAPNYLYSFLITRVGITEHIHPADGEFVIYPNPTNAQHIVRYFLPKDGKAILSIYDASGRLIKFLVNEQKTPGIYSVSLNGRDVSPGVYFYTLKINGQRAQKKKVLIIK